MTSHVNLARRVLRAEMLSPEAELDLVRRAKTGDRRALDQLVMAHSRISLKVASGLRSYGIPIEDLFQEGNVGLMLAAQKFDPARGVRFSTVAIWWVRSTILDYVLRNASSVRIGTRPGQKSLFFKGRAARAALAAERPHAPEAEINEALSEAYGVSVSEVERIAAARDWHLDAPISGNDGDSHLDMLADGRERVDEVLAERSELDQRRAALNMAMVDLSDRERDVVRRRKLAEVPEKLSSIGAQFGCSTERVRQIEVKALAKLTASVRQAVPA